MALPGWSVAVPVALVVLVGCGDRGPVSGAPLTDENVDAVLSEATVGEDELPDSFEWETSEDRPA